MTRKIFIISVFLFIAFSAGFLVSHYRIAHPFLSQARSMLRTILPASDGCLAAEENGICLGASSSEKAPYEDTILEQLPPPRQPQGAADISDFSAYLGKAVGWERIPSPEIACSPLDGHPETSECFASYGHLLKARFLFREGEEAKPLVIVLHGHVSAADKVMGLDNEDYMRAVGKVLAEEGFSVAAPDLTHSATTSSRLNGQLMLHGIQIYGLWSKLACDIAGHFEDRKVAVYGLSNGGVIADHVSVLCDSANISSVFVDDILMDWRSGLYRHPTIHAVQNYALYYLSPLRYESSYLDFMVNSHVRKIYTRNWGSLPAGFPKTCLKQPGPGWKELLAPLVIDYHVSQIELLTEFLDTGTIGGAKEIDLACVSG